MYLHMCEQKPLDAFCSECADVRKSECVCVYVQPGVCMPVSPCGGSVLCHALMLLRTFQ